MLTDSGHMSYPFKIPQHWVIVRGFDFGYAKPFSVGWYAIDESDTVYRIREYYGCTDVANTGLKLNPAEIASEIRRIESEDENLRGRTITGIAEQRRECGRYHVKSTKLCPLVTGR